MMVWLYTRLIYVFPSSNLGEVRDGCWGERAGAIGILIWGELPFSCWSEVLPFDEGELEMGR